MRYVRLALMTAAFSGLVPTVVSGQGAGPNLSITNYQYVGEQRLSQFVSYVTYRADLVNTGAAHEAITASVSSQASNIQVVAGQGNLHFAPVPASRTVTSLDTFTILVDRTIAFDLADLHWTFLAPVANAGPNRTAKMGDTVILDGSGSTNPSGYGSLSYNWKLTSTPPGSSTVLFWYDTVKPQFKVDVPGNYVLTLTVSNGGGSDTAVVTVSTTNTPPVANAGANRTMSLGAIVTLNGSGSSDVDGDPLTYSWTMTVRPTGSTAVLLAPNSLTPVFGIDKAGSYTIRLVVNDGKVDSAPSDVTITTQNTPPVANAGPNQIQAVGALVQLDGSGSTDVDGDPLTYQWNLIARPTGSSAVLSDATAVKPTFTADRAGTYVAQLMVNDGKTASAAVTVQITTNPPLAPTASAGPNQTVAHRTTVRLNGSGTDPQGLPLTYQWSLTATPHLSTAVLASTLPNPTFVADLPGNYVAQLIVSNGIMPSAPSMVTITTTNTAPVADPGLNQFVPAAASVSLNGAGSSDADGDPLTYAWSFTVRPSGSTAVLSSLTAASPTFFADLAGTYVVQLIVFDGFANSNPATVTVTAGVKTITLTPNPLNLSTNTPGTLTVTLGGLAGPGGQMVALDTSNGTIAGIQATVTVPQGLGGINVPVTPGSAAGSSTITALATGFTPGTATVNVAPPAVTVALSAGIVGVTRTLSGVLTLNSPAPNGGETVTLSDPAGLVTFQPASVLLAAGATTGTFTLTGVATGSTTILAGAPGYNTGTVNVTVSMLGAIALLSNVTAGPGQSVPFPVNLVTGAPSGGVTIALTSSDPSKVTISPSSVTIAQGASTPAQQPTVTGVTLGSADISASAPGFFGDTKTVQVSATLGFQQQTLTIGVNGTQNLTLNLSGAAPANGLTVNISSSNTGVATVPTTVSFAPTKTSVNVPVTAVGVGTAAIHASALPGLADTSATVNVVNVGVIGLPANATVGLGQSVAFPVTLPSPAAAGGATVTLVSSDPSKLTISPATIAIGPGQTGPATQPTISGVNVGTANITASATGYTTATQPVQVIATISFAPPSLTISGSTTQNLTLNLSAAAPTGGLTINLSSSNTAAATVPLTAVFAQGATTTSVPVTGVAAGSAVIHASNLPNISDVTANVTVQIVGTINVPANPSVALGQTLAFPVTLSAPAPAAVTVALASSDPSKVTISTSSVAIAQGATAPAQQPTVTGLSAGSATINATAPGYATASGAVQVTAPGNILSPATVTVAPGQQAPLAITLGTPAPAGGVTILLSSSDASKAKLVSGSVFVDAGQTTPNATPAVNGVDFGNATITVSATGYGTASTTVKVTGTATFFPATLTLTTGAGSQNLSLTLSVPAPSNVTFTLSSSNPAAATVPLSITIPANQNNVPVPVTPAGPGSATITASTATPNLANTTANVNVAGTGSISLPSNITLAPNQTAAFSLILGTPAPSGGVTVTLGSSDPSKVTIAPATVTIAGGQTAPPTQPAVTGLNYGTADISATAPGYTTASTAVQVTTTVSFASPSVTINGITTQNVALNLSAPAPASGLAMILTSSNTNAATVPASVNIPANAATVNVPVTAVGQGSTTITAAAVAPGIASATTGVTVLNPGTLGLPAGSALGLGQPVAFPVSLSSPAVSSVTIALTSSDPTRVTLSAASVTITAGQTTPAVQPTVTGINFGTSTITATAAGYTSASSTLQVMANIVFAPPALTMSGTGTQNLTLNLSFPAPPGGVIVTLSSTNPGAVTVPSTVAFTAGSATVQVPVTAVAPGSATIHAGSLPNIPDTTASVTVQGGITLPANVTVPPGQQAPFPVTLAAPAPAGGVTVALTSGDTSKVTLVSGTAFIAQGQTTPAITPVVTGIDFGSASISAAATGYAPVSATVQVSGSASFFPASVTIVNGTGAQSISLTLSVPAPSSVTFSLSSSNTGAATVPSSVTIPANQNNVTVPVTPVGPGAATITASTLTPNIANTTAAVTVTAPGAITLPVNLNVPLSAPVDFPVTLGTPAPAGGVTVTLTSSNPSRLFVAPGTVNIAAGQTTPTIQPKVTGTDIGAVTITASASGYNTAAVPAQVTATIGYAPPSLTIVGTATQNFMLTLSGAAPAGGITVTVTSSNPGTATAPAQVTFFPNGGSPSTAVLPVSGVAAGSTVIHVGATPFIVDTTASVSVLSPGVIGLPSNVTTGPAQPVTFPVTLGTPAPTGGVTVTLTSSDPTKLTVSTASVTVAAGQSTPATQPTVTGVDYGTANITATAPGYTSATSAVLVGATMTFAAPAVTIAGITTQNVALNLSAPTPAGGLTVNLISSNPLVATVPASVSIPANATTVNVPVTALTLGPTTITASVAAPNIANATTNVTVQNAGAISLPSNPTVGLGQTATLAVALAQAPLVNVTIALSSSDTSKVTVSPGSVTIPAGQTTPATQPTITGVKPGAANLTAASPGYTSATAAVQVNATVSFTPASLTIIGTGPQNLTLNLSAAAPAGGITVNVSSSNTAVATVPATVTFVPGQSTATLTVTAVAPGATVVHVSNLPNIADATANVTVALPATVNLPSNPTVGLGTSAVFAVSLANPAPADLTIALASSDPTRLTISPATITIANGQTTPATQPTITGVNAGAASITASGTGVTPASATVQVNATLSFAPPTATITGLGAQTLVLNLSGAAPAGGLTINLASGTPGVATVPPSVNFVSGATSANVVVTAVALGSSTITASSGVPNIPSTTANVTVVSAGPIGLPANPTVGMGKTAALAVTLPQAALANVTVALSSSDPSKLTISPASVTIAAGQTTPPTQPAITGVTPGTATITAAAPGYTAGSASAQVSATVSFTPASLTISGLATQNLTLTLSAAAPAGGLAINLSSTAVATATVPATVTFNAGATTVNVPVTGVAFGTTVIHASALPNIVDTTASVTVQSAGAIGVPASTPVALGQSVTFAITLPAPAPAPMTVTVASSDSSKVAVSSGPFSIAQGATAPTTQPQVTGVNIGSATITASASGYTPGTGTVQATATVTFAQPAVTLTGSVTQNLALNLSAPAPSGGLTVNVSSSAPGVATVPATVTFGAGASSVSVPVTTVAPGTAVIHASATPFVADTTSTVTVQSAGNVVVPASSVVALGGSTPLAVTLSAPAPAALTVTLASADSSMVAVSPATVAIAQGATAPATQPTITGLNIGTTNITVSAPGYATGSAGVQVNATASFTPSTATITGLKTQNLTLTLSAAAPAVGLTVNLSSSNTAVATVPATATFAASATTVNVPVTGVTLGSTVIHASAASFIPDTTASVSVVTAGPIGLPSGVVAGLGSAAAFAVTLPVAAPPAGVTVTLTSADPTRVTVTPGTVSIAAGQTTPAAQPVVNGINVGSASVSASAPGYTTATQNVTVGASVSWPLASLTMSALGPQNVVLTLSGPAPAGGLTVNLSSSVQLIATVPATATFPAGATSVNVPVTAASQGSTVLHASGLNIPDAQATLTVAIATSGVFAVTSVSIGQNLQAQIQVTLSTPVTGGPLSVTLASSDGTQLLLGSLTTLGKPSMVLQFPVGSSSGIAYAQALGGSGTVTVTASAPGYTTGSGTVTLTPSGFVITGPAGAVGIPSFPTNLGNTTTLTVMTGRLDAALNYVETQGIRGGFSVSVPVSSSNLAAGKVAPATLSFTPADTQYTTTFTATAVGTTLVSAGVPTGFSTPAGGANGITANISGGGVTAPNATVGQNLEVAAQVTLTGAPSADTVVTLTSSDPTRLRFGISATDPGVGTIPIPSCVPPVPDPNNACKIIKVRAGQSHSPDIYMQALDSTGSATYTATVSPFGSSTGTVSFNPSGIVIEGPFGRGNTFSVASGSAPSTLTVEAARLDSLRNFVELQLVAPITGVPPVSVNVTSSNLSVGTITASPVTIPAGSAGVTTSFQAVSAGSTTISVNTPAGFTAPAVFATVGATVSTAGFAITEGISLGKFLQVTGSFALGAPAPPTGLLVTLTSNNPSLLLLSSSPTVAGSSSIGINVAANGTAGGYYLQGLASSGTATYTVSAPGFAPHTGTITLTPSGVVVGDGVNPGALVFGNTAVVSLAQLDPATGAFMAVQQLAGGHSPVSIAMSTTVAGATITTPVIISAGTDSVNAVLTGSGTGNVTAVTPAGFTDSNALTAPIFF